ncbi:class I adenylate-forming enzyme family protein [Roseibium sp.]|uniref:class I adenylate-forming enzyme family protein n=1 Tax=Roseibium sp. TaxID=1936156 RepID=UPI003A96E86F
MFHLAENAETGEFALGTGDGGLDAILARIDVSTCFHDLLFYHDQERPDRVAVQDNLSSLTYAQLLGRTERLAARLADEGLRPGDRIALLAKNDVAFVEVMMAASMAGLVLVPLNFRLAQAEIDFIVQDAEAKLIFAGPEFMDTAGNAQSSCSTCQATVEITPDGTYGGWSTSSNRLMDKQDDGSAVLFQMYTSGTTGHPKGVLLTHENVFALCRNGVRFLGPFDAASRSLACMPLFHVAGNSWLFFGLAAGCYNSLVVDISPETLLKTLAEEKITCTLMVPAVIRMLTLAAEAEGRTITGLKTIVFGASPMPAELLKRAQAVFPQTDFVHVYGMTETTCMFCSLDPAELRQGQRLDSCGKPFPDAEMKIVDPDGNETRTGDVGEIICRTPQMTTGYWRRTEATAKAIRDGWYYTGDAGCVDEEGFLYIRDRIKDMLISGGENVYPAEVENAVLAHPVVADVAVVGVPDEKWGEVGLAAVVLKPGTEATAEEIQDTVRERLAGFKVPRYVEFLAELPRNGAGKITKQVLREAYARN